MEVLRFIAKFGEDNYSGDSIIAGDKVMRLNYPIYYFLKINDIDNIQDKNVKNAFAKIIQTMGGLILLFREKVIMRLKEKVFEALLIYQN